MRRLDSSENITGAVLVVGGGIAGMQASLDLADQGYRVFLVESESAIGGHMAQLDKTFPTNDCAMCTISPKLIETGRHLNIELMVDAEVSKLEGKAGDFQVTVRHKPRYIEVSKCVGCGDCAEVCPVSLTDPFNEGLSERKAAYKRYPQAVPNAFAIEKLGIAPCRHACPADQRAQGYIALIAQGRYREAYRVIKEDNPFPSVCGRTCHHPCEGHCVRTYADDPVGIMDLKRFVMDYALAYGRERVEPAPRTRPEWVAIVGAGPAGLTAAHDLAKMGFGVTVYEALAVPGGMMRVGIPAHRLPKGVLQQDIEDILDLGVILKTETPIADPTKLLKEGYNAVCMATGISSRDHSLGVEGEDAQGVMSAATFLRKVNLGEPVTIGERVAVTGGGVTALDAAAVARRLGAEEVIMALDRPRGELPAYQWELDSIEAEGIRILEHTTLTRIQAKEGRVTGVELARTGRGMRVDEQGRRRPRIEPGTEFTLEVDTVIGTIGQQSDLCFLDSEFDDLSADSQTLASEIPGLFIVGGRKTGASYIVEAISLGHRVAKSIRRYLDDEPLRQPQQVSPPVVKVSREDIEAQVLSGELQPQPRTQAALLPMEERITSFREVVLGLTDRQARAEARRCLQCGICSECLACEYVCGTDAIDHNMVEREERLNVGAVILAPGFQPYQAELAQEYGLGRYPNVITSLQLERMLSASGPTDGHVRRPSDGSPARRVAFLQCVGSRDQSHDYCSSVCCMAATKEAILIKEHDPETEVSILMMDVRAFSKGYEAYYQRARTQYGINYLHSRVSEINENPANGDLIVRHVQYPAGHEEDPANSPAAPAQTSVVGESYDLVVLSVGMEISQSVQGLGRQLDIQLDSYGFCETSTFNPIETSQPGIFVVGPFREPKDIPESVIDASGAAGQVGALLAPARGSLARETTLPSEKDIAHELPRVGVFVCHCGSNIAGFLDVEAVTEYADQLPNVVHAEHLLYACSQDSTAHIEEQIQEQNLNRVVVASCTPLTHGPLFQDCVRQAGLNEHLFTMANIRNHCSWVHSDDWDVATRKAKDLVRMALGRVTTLKPLQRASIEVRQAALIIGGGPAGMNAGLTLAEQGFPVHIVEREPFLGGHLRDLYYTVDPTGQDDPQAYLQGLIAQVEDHPRIKLHLNAEVVESQGFGGDFSSIVKDKNGRTEEIEHGATIIATGGQEYRGKDYGFGDHPRVLSQQDLAHLLSRETAPPSADLEKTIDPSTLNQVVMLQCVGPAEEYCARICCATAFKNALQLKKANPSAEVIILHQDIRTYGFKERLYREALESGVLFVRYDQKHKPIVETEDRSQPLRIHIQDPNLAQPLRFEPDMLVLSMPVIPAEKHRELATVFKVPVDENGWFLEAHVKLRPVDFASEGIFLAGAAHYPKFLDEAIVQARAAASRAANILAQKTLRASGAIAQVDPGTCVGCLTCVRICPFDVPQIMPSSLGVGGIVGAAYIEPTACQGCGTCIGECPANAIELHHYQHEQLERQVLSLFIGKPLEEPA